MAKARDIMTDMVVCVQKDTPMVEAAQLLSLNDITGIPVVDDQMYLEGIISEKDVLELFEVMQYVENRTVNSSMSHEVVSCDVEDDLEKVCRCLQENTFRRVPVTEDGKVVGIVSRRDLILYMLKSRRKNEAILV
ncbi:MAG: CBS domain-containing protein [Sedimentisphaerales bacterium]|nr:CBS domain-containing protein [Sedimentisphaerales bacterium]